MKYKEIKLSLQGALLLHGEWLSQATVGRCCQADSGFIVTVQLLESRIGFKASKEQVEQCHKTSKEQETSK